MKYTNIAFGMILMLVFFAPIYYTTGHCGGHAYDEGMTIIKHFVLGQDSCLALGNEPAIGALYFVAIMVSFAMFVTGVSFEEEKKVTKK